MGGAVGSQENSFSLGIPKWRINGSIGYDSERFAALVRARYFSPGNYNSTIRLLNNHIPAHIYVDLRAQARVGDASPTTMEIYNLFDKQPPGGSLYSPFYYVVGRHLSVGARLVF